MVIKKVVNKAKLRDVAGRTSSDMGSGYFPNAGWTWSAYMHNLLVQTDRSGRMSDYDGSSEIYESDPDMYGIEGHFNSGSSWKSYLYVGGPGAG
jgi:neprosin-like protein